MDTLSSLVSDYARYAKQPVSLLPPDIDDQMLIATVRDEIHNALSRSARGPLQQAFVAEVKQLDAYWQDKLLLAIFRNERADPPIYASEQPKAKWWFWIESLDKLTSMERATV